MKFSTAFAVAIAFAPPASAMTAPEASCSATGNIVLSAKTPEVDLYEGNDPSESARFSRTLSAADFPTCLGIEGQAPNAMLKVAIGGKDYWVPPNMVRFRMAAAGNARPICAKWASNSDEQETVGATRGLGQGCHLSNQKKKSR